MIREPQRRFARTRMVVRIALVLVFVSVASLTPFAIGQPRMPISTLTAVITVAVSLLIAAGIWWI